MGLISLGIKTLMLFCFLKRCGEFLKFAKLTTGLAKSAENLKIYSKNFILLTVQK